MCNKHNDQLVLRLILFESTTRQYSNGILCYRPTYGTIQLCSTKKKENWVKCMSQTAQTHQIVCKKCNYEVVLYFNLLGIDVLLPKRHDVVVCCHCCCYRPVYGTIPPKGGQKPPYGYLSCSEMIFQLCPEQNVPWEW